MEKRKKYTEIIVDFFKSTPEVALATFCKEVNYNGVERLRNAIYKGSILMTEDIYIVMYHLSKFRINDAAGWELHQDPNGFLIISTKRIAEKEILCVELENGEVVRREMTPEMMEWEEYIMDDGEVGYADAWVDPLKNQIVSSWFEYDISEYRQIVTEYSELAEEDFRMKLRINQP